MKITIYSPLFNIIRNRFDYKDAFANWALYADEISLAINTSDDGTFETVRDYCKQMNYSVNIVQTDFSYTDDPFMYGKIVNAALQNSSGDILIEQDLDDRWGGNKDVLLLLSEHLLRNNDYFKAYFVPTIDLYGDVNHYLRIGHKWFIHTRGLYRGAVNFGVKTDGHPDYNKTSTDELIDKNGNLVSTVSLVGDLSIESLREYVSRGMPISYHTGYINLHDRAERAKWWREFWIRATAGDENKHITSVEELLKAETKLHGLPLWKTK